MAIIMVDPINVKDALRKIGGDESQYRKLNFSRNPFLYHITEDSLPETVNRISERNEITRNIGDMLQGGISSITILGTKGIGKSQLLFYFFRELKEIETELGMEVALVKSPAEFEDFSNKITTGLPKKIMVFIDNAEKIWDKYKFGFIDLYSRDSIKIIAAWNQFSWNILKKSRLSQLPKTKTIKLGRMDSEHLKEIVVNRISSNRIDNDNSPFSAEAIEKLADSAEGVPYTLLRNAEKCLHKALDENKSSVDLDIVNFVVAARPNKVDLTKRQFEILEELWKMSSSYKRAVTMKELSESLNISRPAAFMQLQNLIEKKVVEKRTEKGINMYYIDPSILDKIETILEQSASKESEKNND